MGIDTAEARDATNRKIYEGNDRVLSNYMDVLPSTSSFHPTPKDSGVDSTSGTPPTRAEYRAAVNQSYQIGPPTHTNIGPFAFFDYTPTLKFYIDRHTPVRYLVSVRGTKFGGDYGTDDLKADKDIAFGQLASSARYQQDAQDMKFVLADKPQGSRVYVTGHSLGGAICGLFLKHGLADGAVTYNPAMQLSAQEPRNHRVYNEHDPLYLLGLRHFNTPPEVKRDDVTATGLNSYARNFGLYTAYDELRAHDLASLSGSGKLVGTNCLMVCLIAERKPSKILWTTKQAKKASKMRRVLTQTLQTSPMQSLIWAVSISWTQRPKSSFDSTVLNKLTRSLFAGPLWPLLSMLSSIP